MSVFSKALRKFVTTWNPEDQNPLQQKIVHWWLTYRLSLQFTVSDIIASFINNTFSFSANSLLEKSPINKQEKAINSKWIHSVLQLRCDVAQPKQALHVTWTQDPFVAWEYGVTFDRYLGLVDAQLR